MAAAQPLKIRMVAGLGNPGDEYAETRHNAGFKAIDELARQAGVTYWKNQAGAEVAPININDPEEEGGKRQIVLVKPQSYMNTSGGPISKLCREYKIKAEELLVIHDELDIPAGDVRVRWAAAMLATTGCVPSSTRWAAATSAASAPASATLPARCCRRLRAQAAARPRGRGLPGHLRPRRRRRRPGDRARRNLRPRSRQRRRFRQRQALKPTI